MKSVKEFAILLTEKTELDLKSLLLYNGFELLILTGHTSAETADAVAQWKKKLPGSLKYTFLMMSYQEFLSSADVFPVEYSRISENYELLSGNDPFREIRITGKNLRHQLEYELRAKKQQFLSDFIDFGISSNFSVTWKNMADSLLHLDKSVRKLPGIKEFTDHDSLDYLEDIATGRIKPDTSGVNRMIRITEQLITAVDQAE